MSSPGGAGNAGKSPPGGAQGHTPGSGKKKNRKKNSPRQKPDSEQSKIVKSPPSEKVGSVKTADVMSQGAPHVQDSTLKSNVSANSDTHKIDFLAQLKAQSAEGLPEKSKMKKMDSETEQVKSTAKSEQSQGQKKGKGQGPKSSETKGHKSEDQSLPNAGEPNQKKAKGQGQKTDQGQVKVEEQGHKKVEGQSSSGDPGGKSKAELKAERRAKQEAQRAAKEKKKTEGGANAAPAKKEVPRVPDSMKADVEGMRKKIVRKLEKQQVPVRTVVQRKVRLFNHLHQYEREVSITQSLSFSSGGIHPAIVKLGLQYAEGIITGSNARCIGLLAAFKKVISDYTTPPHKELSRDLEARIKPYISFLTQCRPLAVSMGNAIKYLKWQITNIPGDMSDMRAKEILLGSIDSYWEEKIKLAGVAISETTSFKIADGDVIVVYACSSLLRKVLCDAHGSGKKFRVIVVDGRPRLEGKEMLRRLVKAGIKCSYVLIGAASYIMKEATKVLLGAHALLANGFVMSRVGSSMIALIAKSFNVPVLVCCETYKFCKRVQTDSFVCNELGDPDDLVDIGKTDPYLMDWRDYQSLSLLNLVYDVTPPEFISMVITEIGMIPCTSVPVVLRVKHLETNEM